jgi:hypothetical protein
MVKPLAPEHIVKSRSKWSPCFISCVRCCLVYSRHSDLVECRPDKFGFTGDPWSYNWTELVRKTPDEVGMTGIYKATTHARNETRRPFAIRPHDVNGCKWLHHCLNMSWTGNLKRGKENYWDRLHFQLSVNPRFNQQLL